MTNVLDTLLLTLTRERRSEEKGTQHSKKDDDLQKDEPPELSAPRHIAKAIGIETIYRKNETLHHTINFPHIKLHKIFYQTNILGKDIHFF